MSANGNHKGEEKGKDIKADMCLQRHHGRHSPRPTDEGLWDVVAAQLMIIQTSYPNDPQNSPIR